MIKTYYQNDELVEKYSIYKGLDELQREFLKMELNKNSNRHTVTLRKLAKKRALFQRVNWFAEDVLTVIAMIGVAVTCILILLFLLIEG